MKHVPDLLGCPAQLRLDAPYLEAALDFAFAGGDCSHELQQALEGTPLPDSDFDPQFYAHDLFLDELVNELMPVEYDGRTIAINRAFVARVLSLPPNKPEEVARRSQVLEALSKDDKLAQKARQFHDGLCQLFSCFKHGERRSRFEQSEHRIATLEKIRDLVDMGQSTFKSCSSALGTIARFCSEIQQSQGYTLLQQLLRFENNLAEVDIRLQLSSNGQIRRFDIVASNEDRDNMFYVSPWQRFWRRMTHWFRGYRLNSHELVERWLDHVFGKVRHILPYLVQIRAHLEVYLAQLGFLQQCKSRGLDCCLATLHEDGPTEIVRLFNPHLLREDAAIVCCDLQHDRALPVCLLTGPNSGGKTRLLQAVGISQLLAQGGWFVPAAQASLRRAPGMYISLIHSAKADDREGRLGSELLRIRELFEEAKPRSVVLLDELCSGTNPSEGEKIVYLVLQLLNELQPHAYVSTHFLSFARRLSKAEEPLALRFLQVELDAAEEPTFNFVAGVATTSLAAKTAARLGVTRDELLRLVRRHQSAPNSDEVGTKKK